MKIFISFGNEFTDILWCMIGFTGL